jgi:hypothetical protein
MSLEELLAVASGEANKRRPHVIVPLYMPLSPEFARSNALGGLNAKLRRNVAAGEFDVVAVAHGEMHPPGDESLPLHMILLYGAEEDDPPLYLTFNTPTGDVEEAVLMNGDGTRYVGGRLNNLDALVKWIAGFLNWNEEVPGLYRLQYALVEGATKGAKP